MKPIVIGIGEYLWDVLPTGKKSLVMHLDTFADFEKVEE